MKAEESLRQQMRINRTRPDRVFYPGEIVFRRLPPGARLPKHLFPEPSTGPCEVAAQPSSSVVLRSVETKELVDQGRRPHWIKIFAGPPRAQVHFEPDSEVRAVSTMLKGEGGELAPVRGSAQAGRRKG